MISTNPFQGISSGQQNISYSVSSQYLASGSSLQMSAYGGNTLSFYIPQVTLNSQVQLVLDTASASSCSSGTKWNINSGTTGSMGLIFYLGSGGSISEILYLSDVTALCSNQARTMQQTMTTGSSSTSGFQSGAIWTCSGASDTNCSNILSAVKAVTNNSANLNQFCSVFQNGGI